ncbi:MAG: hypothetical protein HRT89_23930 [Lentisphaeria bacterium]|nr:hypothetical protein [Lentisphaeria bacterium]NQZ71108.1 hypothetical protein [Lentisphaeria bacterium]
MKYTLSFILIAISLCSCAKGYKVTTYPKEDVYYAHSDEHIYYRKFENGLMFGIAIEDFSFSKLKRLKESKYLVKIYIKNFTDEAISLNGFNPNMTVQHGGKIQKKKYKMNFPKHLQLEAGMLYVDRIIETFTIDKLIHLTYSFNDSNNEHYSTPKLTINTHRYPFEIISYKDVN